MSRVLVSSSALICALLMLSAPARAEDADTLIKQGVELRRERKDREALEHFQRAYELDHSPRAIAQMGLAEYALGRWVDAEAHVVRALAAAQDPWIVKYQQTLEKARETIATQLGSLVVTGQPDGAALRVDGHPAGTLPLPAPLRVATGKVVIEVSASGHHPATREVTIVADQVAREEIVLAPAATMPSEAPEPRPRDGATPVALAREPRPAGSPEREWAKIAAWSAAGLAVGGGAALLVGELEVKHYNGNGCAGIPSESCERTKSFGSGARVGGDVALVGAGVLGVTAVVLYLAAPSASPERGGHVACLPDLARPGASCAFRF